MLHQLHSPRLGGETLNIASPVFRPGEREAPGSSGLWRPRRGRLNLAGKPASCVATMPSMAPKPKISEGEMLSLHGRYLDGELPSRLESETSYRSGGLTQDRAQGSLERCCTRSP